MSVLIPKGDSFHRRQCRTSEKSDLLSWFHSVESTAWGLVDTMLAKDGPEAIFLILGQTMTSECWISHLPYKSTCSIYFENLIHRLTLPSNTTPWIAHDLFPVQPRRGFKPFGGTSVPVSIFIDVAKAPRPQAERGRLGLEVIHPSAIGNSPRGGDFDIVFVHGLGGSARGTWTHPETKWFWPNGLAVKKGFQNARVLTFGYISDWANVLGPQNRLDVMDYALQLLDGLELHYRENGQVREIGVKLTKKKPTFFVAHSMGGLIVKKAFH